ncbi:unnamed protein product (macronuclear) [Paramecium tetraurelia]|uniref:Uncharacterized protein n=1 Tax=Paramecium tetraurelia TaxID=5888 RepID=A0DF77_PARTE|nr:uncharacterized protein GSPATT00016507001 [Paramecium tetraurelia]CAK81694.1 unnamed protein product [Paramecium tetraurelia]|eukprot:XP_001449091.1 hypothetical protein (macronuclear) [Paramecium tetraurelia strain d4-2]
MQKDKEDSSQNVNVNSPQQAFTLQKENGNIEGVLYDIQIDIPQKDKTQLDEQAEFKNIKIFNEYKELFKFLESLKSEIEVCQWKKKHENNHQPSEKKAFSDYSISASKNDDGKSISMQMNIMTSQYEIILIQDQTFTINNICLDLNRNFKIGSFVYLDQTNQIIYEIKQFQLKNKDQIRCIIDDAIKNFEKMIKQYIYPLVFKIKKIKSTFFSELKSEKRADNTLNEKVDTVYDSSNFSKQQIIGEKSIEEFKNSDYLTNEEKKESSNNLEELKQKKSKIRINFKNCQTPKNLKKIEKKDRIFQI